jgi:hypothetical protein
MKQLAATHYNKAVELAKILSDPNSDNAMQLEIMRPFFEN